MALFGLAIMLLLGMMFATDPQGGWQIRYVGWALIVFVAMQYRVAIAGFRALGGLLAFFAVVVVVAFLFGGRDELWNLFF